MVTWNSLFLKSINRKSLAERRLTHEVMVNNFLEMYRDAVKLGAPIHEYKVWYRRAFTVTEDIAQEYGRDHLDIINLTAILSQRSRWSSNIANLYSFLDGQSFAQIPEVKIKMDRIRSGESTADVISGRKIKTFAHSILTMGTRREVTVDTWAYRACAGVYWQETFAINATLADTGYTEIENAYQSAADIVGMTPCEFQAVIWCIVRGTGD